jgi:hypothetical protein
LPNSLLGLALFVLLLAPGLTYYFQRERQVPTRSVSAFRETATVAVASVLFNVVALTVFSVLRTAWPEATPDVGRIIREGSAYIKCDYRLVGTWSAGLLAFACLLAGGWGRFAASWPGSSGNAISFTSAWWELVRGKPADHTVFAGCELEDGSYVAGEVFSFNTDVEETADRELVLRPPITYRASGEQETTEFPVSALAISSQRIKFLTVTYIPHRGDTQGEEQAARDDIRPN